jgi:hypothetical protein
MNLLQIKSNNNKILYNFLNKISFLFNKLKKMANKTIIKIYAQLFQNNNLIFPIIKK